MSKLREELAARGVTLPPRWVLPTGAATSAALIVQRDDVIYVAGHLPTDSNGHTSRAMGKVGVEITPDQASQFALRALLNVLSTISDFLPHASLESLHWARLDCLVNASSCFTDFTGVMNTASGLLTDTFGTNQGSHVRVAYGVAGLPLSAPVEVAAILHHH